MRLRKNVVYFCLKCDLEDKIKILGKYKTK